MVTVKKGSRLEQEVIRRVTAERRLRAALIALKAARQQVAEAREDDAGRDDMLAAINHQMRGPLASVTNAFSLLGDSVLTPEQADWVSAGRHGARALLYQLNQLRELGHLELHGIELDEAEAAVADLLDDVVDLFATQIQSERLELYAQLAPGAGARILCDIGRVRQILINLVSMGLAARRGDRILLSADVIDEELHLWVEVPATAPTVASIVRRPGAREDDAPVTVETGELGLTITRRLVALLDGHLSIDGTTRGDFQVAVRIPWKLARQPRDRHVAKLLDAARDSDVALIVPGRHRDLLLEQTFRRWGVTFHRYERARAILQARHQPTLVVAQGDAANMLRVTARGGIRSVGLLAQYDSEPPIESVQENLTIRCLPSSERALLELLFAPEDGRQATAGSVEALRSAHPSHVLVAEDSIANRMITTRLLEKMGHRVHGVGDGREAVNASRQMDFDIVIMDIKMPNMDGIEATRRILGDPHIKVKPPIVALTGNTLESQRQACIDVGMKEFLMKPVQARELAGIVDRLGRDTQLERLRAAMTKHEDLALVDRAAIMRLAKEVDQSLIPEIGGLFLVELDTRIKDAKAGLENDQLEVVKRSLHALVGSAGSFGARQLVAVIRQIEKICDPAHEELLVQFMRVLDDVAAKTAGRLSAELSSIRMSGN